MTEFIVHADDFGKDAAVNEAIDECFRNGWISEASVMVNMPGCMDAVDLARKNGYARQIGLHLNLTEGKPLTKEICTLPMFCGADGFFNKAFQRNMRTKVFLSSKETIALRKEIKEQIRRFKEMTGLLPKIDSHHHVHTYFPIFAILEPIAKEYGFKSMRISADMHTVGMFRRIYKHILNRRIRRSFTTTTHFDGINNGVLDDPGGVVEVMVHPIKKGTVIFDTDISFDTQVSRLRNAPNSKLCQI